MEIVIDAIHLWEKALSLARIMDWFIFNIWIKKGVALAMNPKLFKN